MTFHIPKLSRDEQARLARNLEQQERIEAHISATPEMGVGSTSTSVEGAKHITVTYAQQADTKGFASGGKPGLIPAHIVTRADGRMSEVLFTPTDYAAWGEGRYCALCWQLQDGLENPDWVVSDRVQPCTPVGGRGCSFPRGRMARERLLPFKVSSVVQRRVAS